jgi:hypothetical protein
MRWNLLVVCGLVGAFAPTQALACKELAVFPEHLEGEGAGWVRRHALIRVTATSDDGVKGVIVQQFGDFELNGREVSLTYRDREQGNRHCGIRLEVGETYLFDTTGSTTDRSISFRDWLTVPSTHPRFPTYVLDLARAEALGNARLCVERPELDGILNMQTSNVVMDGEEVLSLVGGPVQACLRVPAGEHQIWVQSADGKSDVLAVALEPGERLDLVVSRDAVWALERARP